MRRLFVLCVALVAMVATASAADIANFIEVSGKGEVKVKPNEFTLSLTIDEQATKGRYSVEQVEKSVVAALEKIGVEREALTVSGMSSLAVKRKDALTTATYELQLNSVEQIYECYDAFDSIGITNVRITKATNTQMESYRAEARVAAVKDAQLRAKGIGEALEQEVGGCFEVSDRSSYANEAVYMTNLMTRASGAADSVDPIEFRDITVTYNIEAKFLLKLSDDDKGLIVK